MPRNQKLTKVLRGRTLTAVTPEPASVTLHFDDGSVMTVRTDGTPLAGATAGAVAAVRQQDTVLTLDLADRSMLILHTAEPTASVMLRDRNGELEYAD